jgi:hypothetical protein
VFGEQIRPSLGVVSDGIGAQKQLFSEPRGNAFRGTQMSRATLLGLLMHLVAAQSTGRLSGTYAGEDRC